MNSRERMLRLFQKKEVDRVPIWLLTPYHKVGYYTDIYQNPNYAQLLPMIDQYCEILDRRDYNKGRFYNGNPDIKYFEEVTQDSGTEVIRKTYQYRDFVLNDTITKTKDGTQIKRFVDDIDQLYRILEIPYKQVEISREQYLKEKEELGGKGLMMPALGDPLGILYSLMSAEDFAVFSILEYDAILEFLDEMCRRCLAVYKQYLENDIGDVFFIVGAEFAIPPLIQPEKFNEMSARYVKSIVDLIRSYGKYSIVHIHGFIKEVLPGLKSIGMDALHTVEAPPVGNCPLPLARRELEDMILIGNIQYDELERGSKEYIEELVRIAIKEGGKERFILSPTAGPYDENPTAQLLENYQTFVEAGLKYGV